MASTAYIGLGANLGNRERTLAEAWVRIQAACGHGRLSRVYETEPQHLPDQPAYLNAVAEIVTDLDPPDLLDALLAIEKSLGRDRSAEIRMGPRPVDLDILLYGGLVREDERLSIPHPRMGQRRFVLVPLVELAPGLADPRSGRPWAELLPALAGQGVYLHSLR